ncbi:MAG: hypothetical protein K6U75_15335 [Firmicutes bacterium]|nr:hypothetical protein [Bacillota bacterium]
MRAALWYLLVVINLFLPVLASADAFDDALAQVGLSKERARFHPLDLQLYGGGDYRLPFFDSLHLDPWRVPFVVGTLRRDAIQNAGSGANLLSSASLRLSEGTRRTLISDPTEQQKRRADAFKQPLYEAIEAVYLAAGQKVPQGAAWSKPLATIPMSVQKPVAYLLLTMVEAWPWRDLAFREVFAQQKPSSLYTMLCRSLDASEQLQSIDNTAYWYLMRHTDLKALFAGAHDLLLVSERVATELQAVQGTANFSVDIPTPWGIIALRSRGTDTYQPENYLLILDMGGNDTYLDVGGNRSADHPITVVIDLQGNDLHLQDRQIASRGIEKTPDRKHRAVSPCIGGAVMGYAFVLDLQGDDVYTALRVTQGEAHFGVGVLVDAAGNDRYECYTSGQGSATWGIGLLIDPAGDDRYRCFSMAQGYGGTKGYGLLLDVSGSDRYIADDQTLDFPSPQSDKHNVSMAQGAGHDFSLGWLIELGGNDLYRAPNLSLGGGNANGIGIFWEALGDDRYEVAPSITLGRSSIGARGTLRERAICLGLFCDTGGNDTYPDRLPFARNNHRWSQPGTSQPPFKHEYGAGIDCEETVEPETW